MLPEQEESEALLQRGNPGNAVKHDVPAKTKASRRLNDLLCCNKQLVQQHVSFLSVTMKHRICFFCLLLYSTFVQPYQRVYYVPLKNIFSYNSIRFFIEPRRKKTL